MSQIAERLKELRERANHSQEGIAAVAGVSQVTWSNWEKDPPNQFRALARLADRYRTSADYLLGLTDDPSPRRGAALPEPVQEVVAMAAAWPAARQEELLAHAQVINQAQTQANLLERNRIMAMLAAAEDGPSLVAQVETIVASFRAGDLAATERLIARLLADRGLAPGLIELNNPAQQAAQQG